MARRRAPEAPPLGNAEGVPAELALGRCLEVWGSGEPSDSPIPGLNHRAFSAMRAWSDALAAFLEAEGLTNGRGHPDWHAVRARFGRAVTHGAPWSVDYLDATGQASRVDERLAVAGVRREDVPELRRRALDRLAELPLARR